MRRFPRGGSAICGCSRAASALRNARTSSKLSASDITPATYTISGQVATAAGQGLAGVTVSTNSGLITTSAADGSYAIAGLAPGAYSLTGSKGGYSFSGPLSITVTNADVSGQNFVGTSTSNLPHFSWHQPIQ
jgi:hypothetical protein